MSLISVLLNKNVLKLKWKQTKNLIEKCVKVSLMLHMEKESSNSVSPTELTQPRALLTADGVYFPWHAKPASSSVAVDTSWASSNSTLLWHYLKMLSHPMAWEFNPQACLPHLRCQVQRTGYFTQVSDLPGINQHSHITSWGLSSLLEWLTEFRETLAFTSLL
jgi:hypothetical protein